MAGTQNFGELLEPGLDDIYGLKYNDFSEVHSQIFTVKDSSKAWEETLGLVGFGLVPEKKQGQGVSYVDPEQGFLGRITPVSYGLGFIITEEMFKYDQYNQINAFPAALARSNRHTVETVTANIFNNGFGSTNTGPDGLGLFSTAHLLKKGGTFRNRPDAGADLSMTSLEQVEIDIGDLVDDAGLNIKAKSTRLIVANSKNVWKARRLLGSSGDPETANRSINPAEGIMPITKWSFLEDKNAWFVQTDIPGLKMYWTKRPKFTKDNDFNSENALFKTSFWFSVKWDDPRSVVGNPGG